CCSLLAVATGNAGDLDFGVVLAMPLPLHVVLAAAELDDPDLVGAAVGHDLGGDGGAAQRVADLDAVAVAQHQDVVERDLVAGLGFELFDAERFALRHAVLLTAGDHYCVHDGASRGVRFCSYSLIRPQSSADRSGIVGDSRIWGQPPPEAGAGPATAPGQAARFWKNPGLPPYLPLGRLVDCLPSPTRPAPGRDTPPELPMALDYIRIRGARTHNLKNIDVELPRDKLIVITGLSGSGKSSLAFDTIYAEGQRRYVESLSAYARQFLSVMEKPDIDHIEGLSPAISIEQKSTSHNPRSTVGTITEIYDYLRLLYARVGIPRCPEHHYPLEAQTVSQMVDQVMALGATPEDQEKRWMLIAPVVRERKGEHAQVFEQLRAQGYVRVRVDGVVYEIDEVPTLALRQKHTIEAVIDRFRVRDDIKQRLAESFETALKL